MTARRTGLVVELLGAPGAGKSGLAEGTGQIDGVTVVKDHARAVRSRPGRGRSR